VSTLAGEPVVLWFWAPWCTICRVEAPDVAAVAVELEGQVTFFGVPGRGPAEDMQSFVDDTGTGSLQHLVDVDGSLWQRFRVVNQPSFAFVGPDGSVELFAGALGAEGLRERAAALPAG
jgi:thiol-disulfide isomerase/thioredoxin